MKIGRVLVLSILFIVLFASGCCHLLNFRTDKTGAFSGIEEFAPNKRLNDMPNDVSGKPAIAVEEGTIYVVWQSKGSGNQSIYFTKSMNNGTTFSPNIKVDPPAYATQKTPQIAVSGKEVFVVWEDFRNGQSDVFLAHSSDGGDTFGASVIVNSDPQDTKDSMPTITIDENSGALYVVWVHGYSWDVGQNTHPEIHLARSQNKGSSFQQTKVSDNDTYDRFNPVVAVDGNGKVYVAWSDGRMGIIPLSNPPDYDFDVYIANSTDRGASFDANTVLNEKVQNKRQRNPSIAVDSNNDVHAVWVDERFEIEKSDIIYARSSDGSTFGKNVLVNNSSPSKINTLITNHQSPSISVDPSGTIIYVVWYSNRGGNNNVYIAKSTDGGQTFGPASSRFGGSHFFDDTQNGVYDTGEAVISDDGNDLLDPGTLNGMDSPDRIMINGTAGLIRDTQGAELAYHDWNSNDRWDSTESIIFEISGGLPSEYDSSDTVVYNGSFPIQFGDLLNSFSLSDRIVYMDSNRNGLYNFGEPIIKLSHDLLILTEDDTVLESPGNGKWNTHFCPFPLNDDVTSTEQTSPSLATDPWGNVYAVWEDLRAVPPDIYYTDNVDDNWPPSVSDIDAKASYIRIAFSEPVNVSSFLSSISITPDLKGTWSWDPYGHIATFQPSGLVLPSTRYDIAITTGLQDISGNYMAAGFHHSFTTPALPVIIHDPVTTAVVKESITLGARIIDLDGIESAIVFHRTADEVNFTASNMSLLSGSAQNGYWTFTIPQTSNLSTIHYYIVATDMVNNVSRNPFTGFISVKVIDVNRPLIQHQAISRARIGGELLLRADVDDDLEVESVLLYVRPVGAVDFKPPIEMTGVQGDYSASIEAGDAAGTLEYYIRAVDSYGNEALSPAGGKWAPYEVKLYSDSNHHIVIFGIQVIALVITPIYYLGVRKKRVHEAG